MNKLLEDKKIKLNYKDRIRKNLKSCWLNKLKGMKTFKKL